MTDWNPLVIALASAVGVLVPALAALAYAVAKYLEARSHVKELGEENIVAQREIATLQDELHVLGAKQREE